MPSTRLFSSRAAARQTSTDPGDQKLWSGEFFGMFVGMTERQSLPADGCWLIPISRRAGEPVQRRTLTNPSAPAGTITA